MSDRKFAAVEAAVADVRGRVEALDFSLQTRKMVETMGWLPEAVALMEGQYRDFLVLSAAVKRVGLKMEIVPNRAIDEFWHMHVLDTAKYAADCQAVFGEMFHHFPYFGMQSDADRAAWLDAAEEGGRLWRACFGYGLYGETEDGAEADPYAEDRALNRRRSEALLGRQAAILGAARCRTQCRPMKCR